MIRPESLYVHVPFCARRCAYCDFAVEATTHPPVEAWLSAVASEWNLLRAEQGWDDPLTLRTIYVGGGTPSLLGTGVMTRLADVLAAGATWNPETVEWTCEANPESLSPALANDWREAGVNRISLGVQSFHEPALRWMGRLHGADGPGRAIRAARRAGFRTISADLIFGLPAHLERDWSADLDHLVLLDPEHISLYGLTAEPGAPLGRWVKDGRERMPGEERYAWEYLLAHERLVGAGFEQYEVSNFCRPGHASRHNASYWSGGPYAALGPGAHAYLPPVRRWNLRSWDAYRCALAEGRLPIAADERLTPTDRSLERLWLALRTSGGLGLKSCSPSQRRLARLWLRNGWAHVNDGRLRLTAEGWLRMDGLAIGFHEAGGELVAVDAPAPDKHIERLASAPIDAVTETNGLA